MLQRSCGLLGRLDEIFFLLNFFKTFLHVSNLHSLEANVPH